MKSQSAKQKGKLLENYVADQIKVKGLDNKAHRDGASGSGNREKADISTSMTVLGRQAMFECKNQKTMKFNEWWRQLESYSHDGEPILAFKFDRESLEATKVVIYLDSFLELVKKACEPKSQFNANRELVWHLERVKQDAQKTIKLLEK